MNGVYDLPDEAALVAFGERLADAIKVDPRPRIILLQGDLGVGKTTLARALIRRLTGNPAEEVPSPTFTLLQDYAAPANGGHIPIRHYDLYRLKSPDEVYELGWEETLENGAKGGLSLVEWPERLGSLLPQTAIKIDLLIAPGSDMRKVQIQGWF